MNRRRNLIILAVAAVLVIGIGAFAARPRGTTITSRTVTVTYGKYEQRLPETGVVQRPGTTTLAAQVAGNLGRLAVRPGDRVTTGQLLATIENPQIVNAAATARAAYDAAAGRARTANAANAVLPSQNRSSVVQAQAALENARFNLNQAITDQRSGAQTGLGYGGGSSSQQRALADSTVAQRDTDLREAQRIADANRDLFAQKAVSKDALDQSLARLATARVADEQARRDRNEVYAQLERQRPVLSDRVRAARDAVRQAEAQLATAQASAAQDKSGDVAAANADASARLQDWRYAQDQVARLRITAPFSGIVQTVATQPADPLRPLQTGDPINLGAALVTLAEDSGFVVRARVDEQDASSVRPGLRAVVSGEDLGTTTLPGHVVAVGAVAQKSDDPSNTARQIIATVRLDKTVPYLRDGMSVDVDLVTQQQLHVLVVPGDAIRRDDKQKPFVLVVEKGRAVKKAVTLGASSDAQAVIKSGVKPGDVIVAERNIGIVNGTQVKPTALPSASPSPKP